MSERVNILCFKWGKRYGADYVNRLYRGVKAHLDRPFRFVCVTDNPEGLVEGVDAQPFPGPPPGWTPNERYKKWPSIYVKLCVFEKGFAQLEGPTLFLDIDQIVTGDLGRFFDYRPGEFCIIHNWIEWTKCLFRKRPAIGNSSCFRFEAGEASDRIYRTFLAELEDAINPALYRTEQAYMTHTVGLENIAWWPENFVRSFKRSCTWPWPLNHFLEPRFNPDTSILCFHGRPAPEEAIKGYRGKHLNTWTKPCKWVEELWNR